MKRKRVLNLFITSDRKQELISTILILAITRELAYHGLNVVEAQMAYGSSQAGLPCGLGC